MARNLALLESTPRYLSLMSLSPLGCYSILDTGVETQVKQIIVFMLFLRVKLANGTMVLLKFSFLIF